MKPLTEQFIDFARRKPADEAYDYWSADGCACGQFAAALGADNGNPLRINIEWKFGAAAGQFPRTFGALADRLEAMA